MLRTEFMQRLAEAIRPRSVQTGTTMLVKFIPLLNDLGDDLFTDEALAFIAPRLPRAPSLGQFRAALDQFRQSALPPRPPSETPIEREWREWDERQAFLRRDWDNPQAILRHIKNCDGRVPMLRLLALIVAKWAPQHLGYIPPHILDLVAKDSTLPVLVELRRSRGPQSPHMTHNEQLDSVTQSDRPGAYHLSPDQLDIVNPLPNGRKRSHVAASPAASLDPDPAPTEARAPTFDDVDTA